MKRIILKLYVFLSLLITLNLNSQNFQEEIQNDLIFKKLSGLPLDDKYGKVIALKVVYDLESDRLYFINSKRFKYHYEFCNEELDYEKEIEDFNNYNYSNNPKRRFLLANINYFESINTYALEIAAVDLMTNFQIIKLYDAIVNKFFVGKKLNFFLNSLRLQNEREKIQIKIPVLDPSGVYENLNYQAISKYTSYGVLKFVKNLDSLSSDLKPTDIIVIEKTPISLPTVAGIIVCEFQTPLSHLTILGQNRRIPICAYKSAFKDVFLLSLKDKNISYSVLADSFKIKQIKKPLELINQQRLIKLEYNLKTDSLISIENLTNKSFMYAGNKASNFGILYKISKDGGFKVPESAFVIPFYYYDKHIKKPHTQKLIDDVINIKIASINDDSIKLRLKQIRNAIIKTPIDSDLLNAVYKKIKKSNFTQFRFRSSTNAEDARGFSGAGLYSSKTGILDSKKKSIEEAIKKVWASLWSYDAFIERNYYGINNKYVYMAVLAHRAFPKEEVNGVAVTKNLYRTGNYGFVINAQLGNENVVKPKSGYISDQFICYPDGTDNIYNNKNIVDIITTSNLNNGKLVMTGIEIQNLANQLEKIKKYFFKHSATNKAYLDFGLDLEFKLDEKTRDLYIKQVRIFND